MNGRSPRCRCVSGRARLSRGALVLEVPGAAMAVRSSRNAPKSPSNAPRREGQSSRPRLHLEALEDRSLPSAVTAPAPPDVSTQGQYGAVQYSAEAAVGPTPSASGQAQAGDTQFSIDGGLVTAIVDQIERTLQS